MTKDTFGSYAIPDVDHSIMTTMTLEYWPKGYASAEGTVRVHVPDGTDMEAAQAIMKKTHPYGSIISLRGKFQPVEKFDPAYIRMMSNDNS